MCTVSWTRCNHVYHLKCAYQSVCASIKYSSTHSNYMRPNSTRTQSINHCRAPVILYGTLCTPANVVSVWSYGGAHLACWMSRSAYAIFVITFLGRRAKELKNVLSGYPMYMKEKEKEKEKFCFKILYWWLEKFLQHFQRTTLSLWCLVWHKLSLRTSIIAILGYTLQYIPFLKENKTTEKKTFKNIKIIHNGLHTAYVPAFSTSSKTYILNLNLIRSCAFQGVVLILITSIHPSSLLPLRGHKSCIHSHDLTWCQRGTTS